MYKELKEQKAATMAKFLRNGRNPRHQQAPPMPRS
jgi:hypothetical protein